MEPKALVQNHLRILQRSNHIRIEPMDQLSGIHSLWQELLGERETGYILFRHFHTMEVHLTLGLQLSYLAMQQPHSDLGVLLQLACLHA